MIKTVETPETDANCWREGTNEWVAANFARKLERERDEWRESAEELHTAMVDAINSGDWKVDGACDPDAAMKRVLRLEEKYGW